MLVNMTRVFCHFWRWFTGSLLGSSWLVSTPWQTPQELDHFNYTWILHTYVHQNWKTLLYIIISCIYFFFVFANCPCVNSPPVVLHWGAIINFSTSWRVLELLAEISTQLKQYYRGLNGIKTYLKKTKTTWNIAKLLMEEGFPAKHLRLVVYPPWN